MRPSLAVGIVLLVVLAGCGATDPATTNGDRNQTSSTTATPSTTSTTTTSTASNTNTTVAPTSTTTTSAPHFAYENLSNESQIDFDRLRSKEHIESPEPLFGPRIADQHLTTFYISQDGTTFEIRHQRQTRDSKTCLEELDPVSNDTIGDDDEVERYQNLSTEGRQLFDRVANGTGTESNTCYDPTEYPFLDYSHVRKNGTYYSLSEIHGSSYVYVYWLEPVPADQDQS